MVRDVAVDEHKKHRFVLISQPDGTELFRRRFSTDATGEAEFLRRLQPGDQVVIEATPGAFRLANLMETRGAKVTVFDPQEARLVGAKGKKSDYRDCHGMLRLKRAGELVPVWRPDPSTRELRQLTRERQAYNQTIVSFKNRIQAILWDEGIRAPGKMVWGPEGDAWVAEQPLRPATRDILQRECTALRALLDIKTQQEEAFRQYAVGSPEVHRLLQIVGFGPAAAVIFCGEYGALSRFENSRQAVSYAGLNPRLDNSDERVRGGGITKAGRAQLRWVMTEVAWTHVEHEGPEAVTYHRMVARGKPPAVAIVAVARRLVVRAYCLLTRGENDRALDLEKYERKLARLAAVRPPAETGRPSNIAWAADTLERVTGLRSPYRERLAVRVAQREAVRTARAEARSAKAAAAAPRTSRRPAPMGQMGSRSVYRGTTGDGVGAPPAYKESEGAPTPSPDKAQAPRQGVPRATDLIGVKYGARGAGDPDR